MTFTRLSGGDPGGKEWAQDWRVSVAGVGTGGQVDVESIIYKVIRIKFSYPVMS